MLVFCASFEQHTLGFASGLGFATGRALISPACSGGVLAWDMQRAAAAVGPTLTEIVKAAGSKALQEGRAGIPHLALPGGRAGGWGRAGHCARMRWQ